MKCFATFVLDKSKEINVALPVECITKAIPVSDALQPFPGGIDYLEGVLHLDDSVLPVVNLKKRLGLPSPPPEKDSKVAVVTALDQPCGILFDDIKEVLSVEDETVTPIQVALQPTAPIFSHIINLKGRNDHFSLLDIDALFHQDKSPDEPEGSDLLPRELSVSRPCHRFVIFSSGGRQYGIAVENARELTALAEIDETFKNHIFIGAIHLRRETIPILETASFLLGHSAAAPLTEEGQILILHVDGMTTGIIVDEVHELATIYDDDILPMPHESGGKVLGIHHPEGKPDIMLLDTPSLLAPHLKELSSVASLTEEEDGVEATRQYGSQHLITENGYLIFSIGKKFAVEIRHIQEIIDEHAVLPTPDSHGYRRGVINLRGEVIPVINLKEFYAFPDGGSHDTEKKLIIARVEEEYLALEVDSIITISKQEKYYAAPSLRRELADKQDTLDRLIPFSHESEKAQHALVVNIPTLIRNHLTASSE